jgi:hypothetical protein
MMEFGILSVTGWRYLLSVLPSAGPAMQHSLISHVKSPVVNVCFGTVNTTNIKYFHSSARSEANRHPIIQL